LDVPGTEQTITARSNEVSVISVTPGRYQLTTTKPLVANGRSFVWDLELPVTLAVNDVELSLSNAVVLNAPPQAETPATTANQVESLSPGPSMPADESTRAEINSLLRRWIDSLEARNLDEQMSCYAPQLTTYFLKHNVPQSEIRLDKERFLARYPSIRSITISNLQVTGSDRPEATFLKRWDFGGGKSDWHGQVISHLSFTKENGRWVISAERERLVETSVPFPGSER
jgi:hypothetical protein